MGSAVHLLVILMGLSHLLSLNAVPIANTRTLLSNSQVLTDMETNYQGMTEETWEQELINGRMNLETMDYSPPGANPRHTPRQVPPPGGKHDWLGVGF